jgi:hypothetical protein
MAVCRIEAADHCHRQIMVGFADMAVREDGWGSTGRL